MDPKSDQNMYFCENFKIGNFCDKNITIQASL